jgi:predicted SAM-dependent methyltransferase
LVSPVLPGDALYDHEMRFHMGCGEQRIDGYVGVDIRKTGAADLTADLNDPKLPEGQLADVFFSHAFFEHLRRDARVTHLKALRAGLAPEGVVCYMGLPDFRRVAELYLAGGPGVVGPTFDLFHVYRYTHGDPEHRADWWEAQLHKSLFDVDEVGRLLRDAGFASYVAFRYVFPGESDELDLNLGFYATGAQRSNDELEQECREYLSAFDGRFLKLETVRFEDGRTRPALIARVAAGPQRRLLQRIAYSLAARLARHTHPA